MKRLILLLPLLSLAWIPPTGNIGLAWTYPTNVAVDPSLGFSICGTNNIAAPVATWPVLTNVLASATTNYISGTNVVYQTTIKIQSGAFFFTCVASNWWGTADPSNVASTPALPRSDGTLTITRGP